MKRTFVRLAVLFVTTTALSGCVRPGGGKRTGSDVIMKRTYKGLIMKDEL